MKFQGRSMYKTTLLLGVILIMNMIYKILKCLGVDEVNVIFDVML